MIQRCVFIEGIGRCHVLGERKDAHLAVMDGPQSFVTAMKAHDIYIGHQPGRILWSVRFTEKERDQ